MARNEFNSVRVKRPNTNTFNLGHDRKFSLKAGKLYPVMVMECLPTDSFRIRNEVMLRFAPLIAPVMHRFDVSVHYFFVPNRIVWPNWPEFISGGEDGQAEPALPSVTITPERSEIGSFADYLGLPVTEDVDGYEVSAIPFAAYQMIYNEYYRDQNLIDAIDYELTDGSQDEREDIDDFFSIRSRSWQHDYFTSALPFAQKGDEVTLPIGTFEDVNVYTKVVDNQMVPTEVLTRGPIDTNNEPLRVERHPTAQSVGTLNYVNSDESAAPYLSIDAANSGFMARTSDLEAEAATINNLRRAFKVQEWLEKNARGGSRYTEFLEVHFGVKPEDSRLQRPEYIGGSKQPVTVSEVLNTAGDAGGRPQGDMAGHAISIGAGRQAKYFCKEYGYIIGIMSVMPKPAYMQGVPRHFLKKDRFMYAFQEFAHIGEQEIFKQELYVDSAERDATFGYAPRYSEYRYMPSTVHGDFKGSLKFWHAAREFENEPSLNQQFIEVSPTDIDRIFAVNDGTDYLWAHVYNDVKVRRPLPVFGTPRL